LLAVAACAGAHAHDSWRDVASCAGCHPDEQASWSASRHAASFVDGAFHAELEPRREAWCIACHAPLARDPATARDDDPLARAGVGCVACHERDGERATTAACARCHQFNFPVFDDRGRLLRVTDHPMQDTVAQAAGADCTSCHDPHRIAGSHDAATRDGALAVTTCATGPALRVDLANVGAAHNVPTGGVDRHVAVRIWRSSAPERVVERVLARSFAAAPDGGKVVVSDTTIPAGATRTLSVPFAALGGGAVEPVNVELVYVFAADEHAPLHDTEVAASMFRARGATFASCEAR
jgi:hypothetical protein